MEAVCIKLDPRILKTIDISMGEHNYSTRTDFIRESIRDKLRELEKEKALRKLDKYLGFAKIRVSSKRHEEVREETAKEYAKKFGIELK